MTKQVEKEPRVCLECGREIPANAHPKIVTCCVECYEKRVRRQRMTKASEQAGNGRAGVRRRPGEPGQKGTRYCAGGCGRKINDYRCPECWAKLRAKHGLAVHDGDGGFEEHTTWR